MDVRPSNSGNMFTPRVKTNAGYKWVSLPDQLFGTHSVICKVSSSFNFNNVSASLENPPI